MSYPFCSLFFLLPGAGAALLQVSPVSLAPAPPEQQPGPALVPTPAPGAAGCSGARWALDVSTDQSLNVS